MGGEEEDREGPLQPPPEAHLRMVSGQPPPANQRAARCACTKTQRARRVLRRDGEFPRAERLAPSRAAYLVSMAWPKVVEKRVDVGPHEHATRSIPIANGTRRPFHLPR